MNRALPIIFSRKRVAAKFARARCRSGSNDAATYLADTMAEDIAERLAFMRHDPKSALLIGTAQSSHRLEPINNIASEELGKFEEERPHRFESYDLIVHLMGLGMVNDLPGALIHFRNALRDDGLFFAAFPGAGSVPVLRQVALAADGDRPAARIHPQIDNRAGTALLERAGFRRQVVDSFALKVRFSSLDQLVGDLRDQGLTSSLASAVPPISRAGWDRARAAFDGLREEDGKVTETFEILVLTGWR